MGIRYSIYNTDMVCLLEVYVCMVNCHLRTLIAGYASLSILYPRMVRAEFDSVSLFQYKARGIRTRS